MQSERKVDIADAVWPPAGSRSPASTLGSLFGRRDRSAGPLPLPLSAEERRHYLADDFVQDAGGAECFRGLTRAESIEYVELQRVGLDNDDTAFLRLIRLGDRHASAMRVTESR